jgi:putative transposase
MFDSRDDARHKLALWRYDYKNVRPHLSLGNRTPQQLWVGESGPADEV